MTEVQQPEKMNEEIALLETIRQLCSMFRQKYEKATEQLPEMEKDLTEIVLLVSSYSRRMNKERPMWFPAGELSLSEEPLPIFNFAPGWAFAITPESQIVRMQALLFKCDACNDWHIQNILGDSGDECTFEELRTNQIPLCLIAEGIEKHIFKRSMRDMVTQRGAQA